jgi:hypothetical protein
MKRKMVKVALERVSRTDLICVSCGGFRTDWAILPVAAETLSNGEREPQAGIHTSCIPSLHARNTRKKRTDSDDKE